MKMSLQEPRSRETAQPHARFIAETAVRSLLYEVSISPKPGLVDRFDSGAHQDMDIFTYIDSSVALFQYFQSAAEEGCSAAQDPIETLFPRLQKLGLWAEQRMYSATSGINTHKGSIFTLGLLCGGLGYLYAAGDEFDEEKLLALCGRTAAPAMKQSLQSIQPAHAVTGGERLFVRTGQTGIRGEAAAGYPSIKNYGIPALRKALRAGHSINDAGILVLLELLCHVEDSNVFSRGGVKHQNELAERARMILNSGHFDIRAVEELNQYCIQENISPGGCADLLAATLFLYLYFDKRAEHRESLCVSIPKSAERAAR